MLVLSLFIAIASAPALAQSPAISRTQLNPTGRTLNMPVPLLDDDRQLGELIIRIETDDRILVRKEQLATLLAAALKPDAIERLNLVQDSGGLIELKILNNAGIRLDFDPSAVAVRVLPNVATRTSQSISMATASNQAPSSVLLKPSLVAGYLNVYGELSHVWQSQATQARPGVHVDLEAVLRAGAVVFEADATVDGIVDAEACPRNAYCNYAHEDGFKRRRTRLVYDLPDTAIRFQAGDVATEIAGQQTIRDVLGVAIDKAPRILQPDTYGRFSTSRSFTIDRPSEVDIIVNGIATRRMRLRPGNYDLRDLALVAGSNNLKIVIADDTGAQRTVKFTTFFDSKLLEPGKSEWSASGGVPSYTRDGSRAYVEDAYSVSGNYRQGISERITGEVSAQADQSVALAGAGVLASTPWGFFGTHASLTFTDGSLGFASEASWDLVSFRGLGAVSSTGVGQESLRFSADYRSPDFCQPGSYLATAGGLIYPQFNYWLRLSGSYTTPLMWGISATLAGRYAFANDKVPLAADYAVGYSDRYGIDLSLAGPLTDTVNTSITVGYSNEMLLRLSKPLEQGDDAEFRIMARISMRLGDRASVSASTDSLNKQSIASGHQSVGAGPGRWETYVDAYRSGLSGEASIGGSAAYYGNRAEVRASHTVAASEPYSAGVGPNGNDRSSIRLGSSLAFVDDTVAVGAPIRGGAFAVVAPHASLAGKEINVGMPEDKMARADRWGPAVVTDLPAYSSTSLPIDVVGLPIGYSLGAGTYDVRPPYRGGYLVEVGSAYSVSVFGTLLNATGEPLSLFAGVAFQDHNPKRQATVLTNAAGRFAVEGLAPGRWILDMSGDDGTIRYSIDVPKATEGLFRAGTLLPSGTGISSAGWDVTIRGAALSGRAMRAKSQ